MILRSTDSRTRPTLRKVRSTTTLRPLHHRLDPARVEEIPFRADDGVRLGLTRVHSGDTDRPAVLLLHGHTASADMFLLPETRNLVDVLLDDGYEPWLLDWRGSCRLPYNETGQKYTYDDVALYDIPAAVSHIRRRIGDRPLFVVAHCVGSLTLSLSMTAGLVPGLAGVVSQGVFLTPKLAGRTSLRMSLAGELLRSRIDHIPVDIRKAGLWSKYTPCSPSPRAGRAVRIRPARSCTTRRGERAPRCSCTSTCPRPPTTGWPSCWAPPRCGSCRICAASSWPAPWCAGTTATTATGRCRRTRWTRRPVSTPCPAARRQRERPVARLPAALSRRTGPQTATVGRRVHRDSRLRTPGHVPRPGRGPRRVRAHPRIPRRTTVTAARAAGYRTRQ